MLFLCTEILETQILPLAEFQVNFLQQLYCQRTPIMGAVAYRNSMQENDIQANMLLLTYFYTPSWIV